MLSVCWSGSRTVGKPRALVVCPSKLSMVLLLVISFDLTLVLSLVVSYGLTMCCLS